MNTKTHETFEFIRSPSKLLIDFGICTLVCFCSWSSCLFRLVHVWPSGRREWLTHTKGTRVSGGDQGGGGGVGTRGEEGAIDCYRDGETCPWPRGESRWGEAVRRRPFMCPMTCSWCLILASQQSTGIVCKGEKSVRERESDTITAIIEQKKKKWADSDKTDGANWNSLSGPLDFEKQSSVKSVALCKWTVLSLWLNSGFSTQRCSGLQSQCMKVSFLTIYYFLKMFIDKLQSHSYIFSLITLTWYIAVAASETQRQPFLGTAWTIIAKKYESDQMTARARIWVCIVRQHPEAESSRQRWSTQHMQSQSKRWTFWHQAGRGRGLMEYFQSNSTWSRCGERALTSTAYPQIIIFLSKMGLSQWAIRTTRCPESGEKGLLESL